MRLFYRNKKNGTLHAVALRGRAGLPKAKCMAQFQDLGQRRNPRFILTE